MAASPAPEGTLDAVQRIAKEAGAASVAADAAALAARLAEGRFFVACLGQFKRGKSTLLNALVGERALPTGVVPVTSAVTILRHAPSPCARVILASGETAAIDVGALAEYVTEEHNPENAKGVAAVEIGLPSPLLASGTCLVDTPGIGSVFAGNTAVTRRFIPHIDAALVVIGTDPPGPALSGLPREIDAELGFRARKRFQFHELLTLAEPSAGARLLDRLRSRRGRVEAARDDASGYLDRLLSTNSARVVNDLTERVLESRRRLESEMAAALRDVLMTAERSLDQARRSRHCEGRVRAAPLPARAGRREVAGYHRHLGGEELATVETLDVEAHRPRIEVRRERAPSQTARGARPGGRGRVGSQPPIMMTSGFASHDAPRRAPMTLRAEPRAQCHRARLPPRGPVGAAAARRRLRADEGREVLRDHRAHQREAAVRRSIEGRDDVAGALPPVAVPLTGPLSPESMVGVSSTLPIGGNSCSTEAFSRAGGRSRRAQGFQGHIADGLAQICAYDDGTGYADQKAHPPPPVLVS
jgi:hypothetical protein